MAERAPVLQAWQAIAAQPRILAELERREAVLIGYTRVAAAAEQTWRTTLTVMAEPEAWMARAWAAYAPKPRIAGRPSRDASPGPSPG